ncbi:MAG TPA: IS200/IS605 family transposase [Chloroflexia bacterium]|nr:IS200/IS605 family transposase [Chloroflexia bacterium]
MAHTFTHLITHVVFGTKNRASSIALEMGAPLHAYLGGIVKEMGGKPLIINGTQDHVHMLIALPATMAIADLIRVVKANSSRWAHEKWPQWHGFGWQQGYGAFSVSKSAMKDVEEYIANQEEHHRKVSFQEEFLALLKRHDIPYDERYIWE